MQFDHVYRPFSFWRTHAPALEHRTAEYPSSPETLLAQASRCLDTLYCSIELEHLARFTERIQAIGETTDITFRQVWIELEIDVESLELNGVVVLID